MGDVAVELRPDVLKLFVPVYGLTRAVRTRSGKDEISPCLHHGASLLQQISAVIGGFDLVFDSVGQRAFGKVPGIAFLAAPVAKA